MFSDNDADAIVDNYFNYKINNETRMKARVLGNVMVKILYIIGNVAAFIIVNEMLNGDYRTYGLTWMTWSKMPNAMAYDYMGKRKSPSLFFPCSIMTYVATPLGYRKPLIF